MLNVQKLGNCKIKTFKFLLGKSAIFFISEIEFSCLIGGDTIVSEMMKLELTTNTDHSS